MNQRSGQGSPDFGKGAVAEALWISEVTFYCQAGYRHLIMSGAFEKFPRLKYVLTESGCAWVPAMLNSLDRIHRGLQAGAIGEMNYRDMQWILKETPGFYAARNCYYGASSPSIDDLNGIERIGVDKVLWGNDYPHYEGTFPYNLDSLQLTFSGLSDSVRRKVLGENSAALHQFDVEALSLLADQYGPIPSQLDTPLPRDRIPRDSTCCLFQQALYGI